MRVARTVMGGRGQAPLQLYGINTSIFHRKLASNATLSNDQTAAYLLSNQLSYGNPNYSWNGTDAAPSFYGYPSSGPAANQANMGWAGYPIGYETTIGYTAYTIPVYVVDSTVPNQKVTYVSFADGNSYLANTYTVHLPGWSNNLQNFFNAVPVPDVTKIPQGQIQSDATDGHAVIWRPSTNELWEMWRFNGSPGSYVFGFGAYIANVNTFNGIFTNGWGARACGLASAAGLLTIQDVVDVLRGGAIKHALGISIPVTANSHTAPATRNDSSSHTYPTHPYVNDDGVTPNLSAANSGFIDAVAEGTWCRLPASFNPATAMPGAGPLALAIATAIRDYGLFVHDGGGNCAINLEDARALGSPYSYAKVNPFAGSTGAAAGFYDAYINNNVPGSWTDSTLPKVTEVLHGPSSVFSQIPWQQLQVLQPFSS
jgi:hypothetical protein